MKRWMMIGFVVLLWVNPVTALAQTRPEHPLITIQGGIDADTAALDDPSFEAGTPSPYWIEESLKYGTPICATTTCGDYGRTGMYYAWFGGVRDEREIAVLSQAVRIEETASTLTVWLKMTADDGQGQLRFSIDGEPVRTITHNDLLTYAQYAEVAIDLSRFADGEMYTLAIDVHTEPSGLLNFYVDDWAWVETLPTSVTLLRMRQQKPDRGQRLLC